MLGRRRQGPKAVQIRNERAAILMVLSAAVGLVALLGVPRSVAPEDLPEPRVRRELLARQLHDEARRAQEAVIGLPFQVRAVGELLRRVGRAEADRDESAVTGLRTELLEQTRLAARESGGPPLLALRALQTRLFLEAMGDYAVTRHVNSDLLELGGAFLSRAEAAGWIERERIRVTDKELGALFRIRWTELTGLSEAAAFAPTLNDWRLFYRVRFRHSDPVHGSRTERLQARLSDVRALAKLDAEYPSAYATGILLYQLGALEPALEAFRSHLRLHPDGDFSLRARNYATACAEALFAGP